MLGHPAISYAKEQRKDLNSAWLFWRVSERGLPRLTMLVEPLSHKSNLHIYANLIFVMRRDNKRLMLGLLEWFNTLGFILCRRFFDWSNKFPRYARPGTANSTMCMTTKIQHALHYPAIFTSHILQPHLPVLCQYLSLVCYGRYISISVPIMPSSMASSTRKSNNSARSDGRFLILDPCIWFFWQVRGLTLTELLFVVWTENIYVSLPLVIT
jgi:hypothetical protein